MRILHETDILNELFLLYISVKAILLFVSLCRSLMVDRDEGDDFIEDIVGEVCSSAMKIIYDNYIQKQLLPYTVSQARDALIQIIEVSCLLLVIFFLLKDIWKCLIAIKFCCMQNKCLRFAKQFLKFS